MLIITLAQRSSICGEEKRMGGGGGGGGDANVTATAFTISKMLLTYMQLHATTYNSADNMQVVGVLNCHTCTIARCWWDKLVPSEVQHGWSSRGKQRSDDGRYLPCHALLVYQSHSSPLIAVLPVYWIDLFLAYFFPTGGQTLSSPEMHGDSASYGSF